MGETKKKKKEVRRRIQQQKMKVLQWHVQQSQDVKQTRLERDAAVNKKLHQKHHHNKVAVRMCASVLPLVLGLEEILFVRAF